MQSTRKLLAGLALAVSAGLVQAAPEDTDLQLVRLHRPGHPEELQAQTGIAPKYDVYDSNEVLEAKLLSGHSATTWWCPATASCPTT
ncbi:hypothetical protein ACP3P8_22935 [Pseudomonas aeruginosa]